MGGADAQARDRSREPPAGVSSSESLPDDPGDPQDEGEASYFRLFEPEYAWIDTSQSADEVERQVRAWRFHSGVPGDRGALTDVDGETVRVLRVSRD